MSDIEFQKFPKIPRLSRTCWITEKIDGTNATIYIGPDHRIQAAKRTAWITPEADNHGFAAWVLDHAEELVQLGPGWHRGEWWGKGINRGYGLSEKRFSLFNQSLDTIPVCCFLVPVLYHGEFDTDAVHEALIRLHAHGSYAAPGYMRPEGVVIFHEASGHYYKKTLESDDYGKT